MLLNSKDKVEKRSTIHKTYAMEAKKPEMSGPWEVGGNQSISHDQIIHSHYLFLLEKSLCITSLSWIKKHGNYNKQIKQHYL